MLEHVRNYYNIGRQRAYLLEGEYNDDHLLDTRIFAPAHCLVDPSGHPISVTESGRLNTTQHSHDGSRTLHLHVDSIGDPGFPVILIDLSDLAKYKHEDGDFVHIEGFHFDVDANDQANYTVSLGYISASNGTNGTFSRFWHLSGAKKTGSSKEASVNFYPNGTKCHSDFTITGENEVNVLFRNDPGNELRSVFSTGVGDTTPDLGDLIVWPTLTAGEIDLALTIKYHTDTFGEPD